MFQIDNRTPHQISLVGDNGSTRIVAPSRPPVRVRATPGDPLAQVLGVPIHAPARYAGVDNLPPRRHGTVVVVSQLAALAVAATMPDRDDVAYPDTGPDSGCVRDAAGILAVRRLIRAT